MRTLTAVCCLLSSLLLAGCAVPGGGIPPPGAVVCIDPRPQICTMDYTPVCAMRDGGETATYANACGACMNYIDGFVAAVPSANKTQYIEHAEKAAAADRASMPRSVRVRGAKSG